MFKRLPIAAVVALSCALPAHSQNKLDEIVVTSSRIEMPLRQIGTSMSVITDEDIEKLGFNNTLDILRTVPGVAGSNSGGLGKASALRIRGEESFRTQIYIDGLKVSDPTGTQVTPQIQHILGAGLQRKEVLRGPQGLMYGADGGGVINMLTGNSEEGFQGNISAELGEYDTQQVAAVLGLKDDRYDIVFTGTDLESDGFSARKSDLSNDEDGYENKTAHLKASAVVADGFKAGVVLRDTSSDTEFDGCFGSDDCSSSFEQSAYRLFSEYSADRLSATIAYTSTDTERESFTSGFSTFATQGDLNRIEALITYDATELLSLVMGADQEEEDVIASSGEQFDRKQTGIFAEAQFSFSDNFFGTIGLRNDDHDTFGSKTTYRATTAYIIDLANNAEIKLKASAGTGFRAPSISEQAYNNGDFAFGEAAGLALSEETSQGFDFGIEYVGSNGSYFELVYFDQSVEDEIFFDLVQFQGYLQALGDTDTSGAELTFELPITTNLLFDINYTYNSTATTAGETRIRRPKNVANLGLTYTGLNDALKLNLNMRAARDSENQIFGVGRVELDDYEVFNLKASYQVLDGFHVYGRVENLFDEDYEEVTDFNTSGRAFSAGFKYSF